MRRALPFAILGACLVVGVLPALAADQSVAIHDFRYAPASVAVKPGETVTWRADGYYMHSVHFDGEATGIGTPSSKYTASRTFPDEGKFAYHCDVHATMHGVVYVNQSGTVPAPPATPTPDADRDRREPDAHPFLHARRGGSATPLSSFRAKASVRKRKVFLTLTVGGDKALRVRGTLKRGSKRVRRVSLLARPGRHKLRLPGKRLKPGRYTLTLKAGDLRRIVQVPRPALQASQLPGRLDAVRGPAALAPPPRRGGSARLEARRRAGADRARRAAVGRRRRRAGAARGRVRRDLHQPEGARARHRQARRPSRSTSTPRSRTCSATASRSTDALELLGRHDGDAKVLVVGHNPSFAQVVHDLTGARVDFKKGAVAAVRLRGRQGELIVLLRPRELESLAVSG